MYRATLELFVYVWLKTSVKKKIYARLAEACRARFLRLQCNKKRCGPGPIDPEETRTSAGQKPGAIPPALLERANLLKVAAFDDGERRRIDILLERCVYLVGRERCHGGIELVIPREGAPPALIFHQDGSNAVLFRAFLRARIQPGLLGLFHFVGGKAVFERERQLLWKSLEFAPPPKISPAIASAG